VSASVVLASECPPDDPGFCAPSVLEFFPKPLATFDLFGVHFAITRITIILWIATAVMVWFFVSATRNMQLVPGKRQYFAESGYSIIRDGVAREVIGTEGLRFAPYLASLFFFIVVNNIMGIIPFAQIPPTGRFAFPVVLATISYILFNWVGIRQQGVGHPQVEVRVCRRHAGHVDRADRVQAERGVAVEPTVLRRDLAGPVGEPPRRIGQDGRPPAGRVGQRRHRAELGVRPQRRRRRRAEVATSGTASHGCHAASRSRVLTGISPRCRAIARNMSWRCRAIGSMRCP